MFLVGFKMILFKTIMQQTAIASNVRNLLKFIEQEPPFV